MSAAGSTIVSLRDVSKSYENSTLALSGFNFNVREGEFVSLLGPSGCGKSTALRILAGLADPSAGAVDWTGNAAHLGFVFQESTLMPWASVADNVRLPLRLAHAHEARSNAAVSQALERVGLTEFAQSYPRELSGGMKMRVSIARALATEPQLLLMDEPFAALDEITRFRLNNDLLKVWQELRRTVVFVTHSVFESVYLSQRIVVMSPRPGRIFTEIEVPASYPREDRYRMSPEYAGYCRQVADALAAAMEGAS